MTQVNIGKGLELAVDFTKFSPAVIEHVLYIGARNILMDCHAGITPEKSADVLADSLAMAEKKLAAMYAGDVRSAGTRTADPVKAEAIRIATDKIKSEARKAGTKVSTLDAKLVREAAIALVDRTPAILAQARKNVAENKAVDVTVDLAALIAK